MKIEDYVKKAVESELTNEDLIVLSTFDRYELFKASHELTERFFAKDFHFCSIVNAKSGKCSEDCKWCAQSGHYKTGVEEYPIVAEKTTIEMAKRNDANGVDRFSFVTSGRTTSDKYLDLMLPQVEKLREQTNLKLCASMGLLTKEHLQKLYDKGISRYHCNIETAPSFFKKVCTTHTIEEKQQTINYAKEVGMSICSGVIIGLGETMEQRIEAMLVLRDMKVDSIPINVLCPIEGTPLENVEPLTTDEILTTIALFRFSNPKVWLRFAGGRTKIVDVQDKAIYCGVNSAIVGDMLTTEGLSLEEDVKNLNKYKKDN